MLSQHQGWGDHSPGTVSKAGKMLPYDWVEGQKVLEDTELKKK